MNTWAFAFTWVISAAVGGGLLVVGIDALVAWRKRRRLIAAGIYPRPGTGTDEDVQRLLSAGHTDMAVRCYQSIHQVSYQQAKDRLHVTQPRPFYGFQFFGLAAGMALGAAFKQMPLGAGLGLVVGSAVEFLMRRHQRNR